VYERHSKMMYRRLVVALVLVIAARAAACPFCNAIRPTITQQREGASVAFVGEALDKQSASHGRLQSFKIHRALKGSDLLGVGPLKLATDAPVQQGTLALLLGTPDTQPTTGHGQLTTDKLQWTAIPLDEAGAGYVTAAPDMRQPSAKRLAFFGRFLEHANPLIADDAYEEFAHATFDQTAEAVAKLSQNDLRRWLIDPQVPQQRKGFYALALGLAKNESDREANGKLLRARILAKESDFRAGFDGVLAGYLLLAGRTALELIESRYLLDAKAADGDVRSALKALRFYHDFGHDIPPDRIAAAEQHVLDRPEFAAEAITDIARWQDWRVVERVAALYERKEYSGPLIRRAIVGYLKTCPEPAAATALVHVRHRDPTGVAEAEKELSALSGR
jgi:hypothetical protein